MNAEQHLWQYETQQLCALLQGVHGGHGVVMAPTGCGDVSRLAVCTGLLRLHAMSVDGEGAVGGAIRGQLTNWPLASESCDLLLLWHVIDRQPFWPMVIEEASRVIAPGGLLVVVYHGAFSPWRLRRYQQPRFWPAGALLHRRMRDCELQPIASHGLSWQPPLGRGQHWQRFGLDAGGPWWPWPACSSVTLARREKPGMTPIQMRDRLKTPASGQLGLAGKRFFTKE